MKGQKENKAEEETVGVKRNKKTWKRCERGWSVGAEINSSENRKKEKSRVCKT